LLAVLEVSIKEDLRMNARMVWVVLTSMVVLLALGIWEQRRSDRAATDRLGKIERRLSRLEKLVGLPAGSESRMARLGDRLKVDEHGTIWDDGRPVGTWGVDDPGDSRWSPPRFD
jgi:hypothetical protein